MNLTPIMCTYETKALDLLCLESDFYDLASGFCLTGTWIIYIRKIG